MEQSSVNRCSAATRDVSHSIFVACQQRKSNGGNATRLVRDVCGNARKRAGVGQRVFQTTTPTNIAMRAAEVRLLPGILIR